MCIHCTPAHTLSGELIVNRYVAESITTVAGCFGHVRRPLSTAYKTEPLQHHIHTCNILCILFRLFVSHVISRVLSSFVIGCMYVCMYVCMHVRMYVCTYVGVFPVLEKYPLMMMVTILVVAGYCTGAYYGSLSTFL